MRELQKIMVHDAAISSVMSKIVIKHHDRNDPFMCCKREEEKKVLNPSQEDLSLGLHDHNVEFSPLNYSHMLVKSNQYYKKYRNYIN
ncbi:hypothetical protein GQ457_07G003920 [Hibiscus cannabinus]